MSNHNEEVRNNFLDNFITKFINAEKIRISNFLANNPDVLASSLAEEMVYVGLPVLYVSAITSVPIEALNKFRQFRH